MNLDEILAENNPSKFIYELAGFVTDHNLGGVSPKDLEQAPPMVRSEIYLKAFNTVTVTSSIYQWLIELYDDYPDLAEFFDEIRAERAAAYIRAALALFPKGKVPKSMDSRLDFCDEHEDELREIDRKFKGASEDAIFKFRDYIIANRESFEIQVHEYWKLRKKHKAR